MPIGPGTRLGQYEVQEFVGQGAMGLVYRAYHAHLQRTGAVKVMQALAPDSDAVARFRHEAQAIAQMRHPNIVNVYDFGEYEGTPYMIVEYVPGGSLASRLSQGMLDHPTAVRYLRGIGAGLDYAHAHGVVHRDVKPANVLLTAEDTPVLADFGLAKLLQGSSLRSMTGVTTGTPAYMAPEQVTGSAVGPAADRYSLATIAYEMLTGVIPFDGEALMELLYAQVHRYPDPPSARQPALGPNVDTVVMRGLAKNPADRWESCGAFVDALGAVLPGASAGVAHTVVMAPPVAPTVASAVPTAVAPVAPPASQPSFPATAVMSPAAGVAVGEAASQGVTGATPGSYPPGGFPPSSYPPSAYPPSAYPPASYPVAASPAPARKRSRAGLLAVVAIGVVVVILIAIVARLILARNSVTLTLSSSTVVQGDTFIVSATHVPANESGEIQVAGVRTVPFQADSSGSVTASVTVPRDASIGDHVVRICWAATCHKQTTLTIVARTALVTPVGIGSPVATASATAAVSPAPTGCPPVVVTVASISKSGGFTVDMRCAPAGQWTISVVQGGHPYLVGRVTASGAKSYITPVLKTPSAVVAGVEAHVAACDATPRCYDSSAVTVAA